MHLVILLIIFSHSALAGMESIIEKNCSRPKQDSTEQELITAISSLLKFTAPTVDPKECLPSNQAASSLSKKMDALKSNYKSKKKRSDQWFEYTKSLDGVIKDSPFAYILKCREKLLKDKKFKETWILADKDNPEMSVNYKYPDRIEFTFSTQHTPEAALFVYLHELTHVCQIDRTRKLMDQHKEAIKKKNPTEVHVIEGELMRQGYLDEIEAFYTQQMAYRFFTSVSPRFCREEVRPDPKDKTELFEAYLDTEKDITNGVFAQSIVYGYYFDKSEADKKLEASSIFETNTPSRKYNSAALNEGSFTLQDLHPDMKKKIQEMGIQIKLP